MSASTTPSSESLERDAAALHTGHGKVDAGEIAIAVMVEVQQDDKVTLRFS